VINEQIELTSKRNLILHYFFFTIKVSLDITNPNTDST